MMAGPDERAWLDRMARLDDEEAAEETAGWLEATGLGDPPRATFGPPATTLEPFLQRMPVEQLKRVLARYAPGSRAGRKDDMIAQIERALASPPRLAAVVADLAPLERDILAELKRRGGAADAHELATFLVLRGYRPSPVTSARAYGQSFRRSALAGLLAGPILEGLVLVATNSSSWFGYGFGGDAQNQVTADPRLLHALSAGAPDAPHTVQGAALVDPGTRARHPAAVVLELRDVLRLVVGEGGLAVTRRGAVAIPFLRRLARKRPALAARLEPLLVALVALGLVRRPDEFEGDRRPWPVDADGVEKLLHLPLPLQYAVVVDADAMAGEPGVRASWRRAGFGASLPAFWRAALDALAALPEHPLALEEAAGALWDQVLAHVFGAAPYGPDPYGAGRYADALFGPGMAGYAESRVTSGYGADMAKEALQALLAGPFARAGLVAIGPVGTSPTPLAVVPALGARWYGRARAMLHHHVPGRMGTEDGPVWARAGERRRAAAEPSALLLQPNFDVLVYLDRLDAGAVEALECAELARVDDHTAGFRLSRSSLHRALDLGATLEDVLGRLRRHAPNVPDNVAGALRDWAAQRERLRVTVDVRVLEYASRAERDAALGATAGARPVGERFAVLAPASVAPTEALEHRYDVPPEGTLTFSPDGSVRAHGALDLAARAALRRVARPGRRGWFELDAGAIGGGALTPTVRAILEERARGGLAGPVDALLRAWSGDAPAPAVAVATLFRHPDAAAWAQHPRIGPHLGAQLSPSTYLVKEGEGEALAGALAALGVAAGAELVERGGELAAPGEGLLLEGLSTRRKRELIEDALRAGHTLELRYASERERVDAYGSTRRSRGSVRHERVRPAEVVYRGSLPYLLATTVGRGRERVIRIGYVEALAVRGGDEGRRR